ncbi:MAG: S41 family peptidase [Coriobacteriia bacterium]|nr:S41 family peptidase [Coriobacteriia bacterium]
MAREEDSVEQFDTESHQVDERDASNENPSEYGVTYLAPHQDSQDSKFKASRLLPIISAIFLVLAAFSVGMFVGKQNSNTFFNLGFPVAVQQAGEHENLGSQSDALNERLNEVVSLLDKEALEKSNFEDATEGVISGLLLSTNDSYARYYTQEEYNAMQDENAGQFGGIGIVMSDKDGKAYVVKVYPDTPAERAGLKAGDYILAINGERRNPWTVEEVAQALHSEVGTSFEITWVSVEESSQISQEKTATLVTEKIEYPVVASRMLDEGLGLIQIDKFNSLTAQEVQEALDDLNNKGAQGFIVDLRGNPGGPLDAAVKTTSLFIESGAVVDVRSGRGENDIRNVDGKVATNLPLVVLVDSDSASSAEIFTGAIQDHKRGLIVGDLTFGKGTVQIIEPLSFGGGIKFTIAHYFSPEGNPVDKLGILPDVIVEMNKNFKNVEGEDTQLAAGVKALQAIIDKHGSLDIADLSNSPGAQEELTQEARKKREAELDALALRLKEAQYNILSEPPANAEESTEESEAPTPEEPAS